MAQKIDAESAAEWLNKKWHGPKTCPVCQNNNWNIGEQVVELRPFEGGALVVGGSGSVYPLFAVTCNVCGNTLLFNAIVSGLMKGGELVAAQAGT